MYNNATLQFRDFLQMYNILSTSCFKECVTSFNSRTLEGSEIVCVESCAEKYIKTNRRVMDIYVVHQQTLNQKRLEEAAQAQSTTNNEQIVDEPIISNANTVSDTIAETSEVSSTS